MLAAFAGGNASAASAVAAAVRCGNGLPGARLLHSAVSTPSPSLLPLPSCTFEHTCRQHTTHQYRRNIRLWLFQAPAITTASVLVFQGLLVLRS